MTSRGDQRLEIAMGNMLRIGVTIAALVVLTGGVLYLRQFHGPAPDYQHFYGASAAYGNVGVILSGVRQLDSRSLIAFGILLLIATPVCRVIFGVIGFSLERDLIYATVSAIVLAILLTSFFTRR
jgi:uncharacterized membrane protein